MTGYITGFSVYTLAMIGVIFVALIVVKKSLSFIPNKNKTNFLKVENCLNIEPRKNLYVVKAGRERFLISSAGDNCQFMTKLEVNSFLQDEIEAQIPQQTRHSEPLAKSCRAGNELSKIRNAISDFTQLPFRNEESHQLQNNVKNDDLQPEFPTPAPRKIKSSKYFTGAF